MIADTAVPSGDYVANPSGTYSAYSMQTISDDPDTQVAETISVMGRYAQEDSTSDEIRNAVAVALSESKGGDPVDAVWGYVKSRMHFVEDVVTGSPVQARTDMPVVEVLVRPRDMSTWWQGDCDDYTMLGASMLLSLSVPVKFATVGADAQAPNEYTHVYLIAYPNGVRVPMDLSHGKYIGWEVDNHYGKFREWDVVSGLSIAALVGIGALAAVGFFGGIRKRRPQYAR